jgi:hypothetical protein
MTAFATRAIPELVKRRGLAAIRQWLTTDRPWLESAGCSWHGLRERGRRINVVGFWYRENSRQLYSFRPLATFAPGDAIIEGKARRWP